MNKASIRSLDPLYIVRCSSMSHVICTWSRGARRFELQQHIPEERRKKKEVLCPVYSTYKILELYIFWRTDMTTYDYDS